MLQRFQDSMAHFRKFRKPDLFLTMTCHPKWPEITQLLMPHQKSQDRFDIVTRTHVFHVKLHKMIKGIVSNSKKIFGATKGTLLYHWISKEGQKRGLPLAHILLWLEVKTNEATFDEYACAEIPDATTQPILFQSVKSHMMPGPCGGDKSILSMHEKGSLFSSTSKTVDWFWRLLLLWKMEKWFTGADLQEGMY